MATGPGFSKGWLQGPGISKGWPHDRALVSQKDGYRAPGISKGWPQGPLVLENDGCRAN